MGLYIYIYICAPPPPRQNSWETFQLRVFSLHLHKDIPHSREISIFPGNEIMLSQRRVGEDHTDHGCLEHKDKKPVRRETILHLIAFHWFNIFSLFGTAIPTPFPKQGKLSALIKTPLTFNQKNKQMNKQKKRKSLYFHSVSRDALRIVPGESIMRSGMWSVCVIRYVRFVWSVTGG